MIRGSYKQNKVLPEPFIGKATAPVVLLSLNPGFDDRNIAEHARADFQLLIRNNYRHKNPAVSPGNCPGDGFDLIVSAIRDGDY
jgi:hypothetical protein